MPLVKSFYTYAEAVQAVQKLKIKTRNEYRTRYREDLMLPSYPSRIYEKFGWVDWYAFLGSKRPDIYPDYRQAVIAVQLLKIKTRSQYIKSYRQDPRLPASPHLFYAKSGWTNWYDFLGSEKRPRKKDFYQTYAEAKIAVQRMGVNRRSVYLSRFHEDPKLPSNPNLIYADVGWVSWREFLANSDTVGSQEFSLCWDYFEAQSAVRSLGIVSIKDYRRKYREDPRLPANPHRIYAGSGWSNWYVFFGTKKPGDNLESYPKIWAEAQVWLKTQTGIRAKKAAIKTFLGDFCLAQGLPDDVRFLLLRTNYFNSLAYQSFVESRAESQRKSFHSAIKSFFGWLLDEYCTDIDSDERVVLPGFRNPFETVMAGFSESLKTYRPSESTKPPLGYEYILRARNYLVPNGEQVLQARPCLRDLGHLQDLFDGRSDWIYVDESIIDRNDPNCIWRKVDKADRRIDGERVLVDSYQIWSPVRFVALYTLLRFPLRGQQILWMDSGEADKEVAFLDVESGCIRWVKNTSHLVGKLGKSKRPQGAVQRGESDAPKLYITTNKTGRLEGGYDVEWIPDDLIYWLLLLRDWQIKYNPIKEPTPWTNIRLRADTNEKILKARGAQCFLFRIDGSGQPLFTTTAFTHTLPALLNAIQRPGEKLVIEDPDRRSQNKRYISPYTPHSLRVSLITAFISDGEAPIHLVSKLVGHASLVMTIYYIKLKSHQMRCAMGEAEKRAAQIATERHAEMVRAEGLKPFMHQLIATDGNRSLLESDVPNSACVVFDCGICPMSAGLCHIGGKPVVERKTETTYAPVEAGYLGQKNCPRCRFFVTGVPFLGGLVALANEIALEIHTESSRFQSYTIEVDQLEQEFYDACQANLPDIAQGKRKQAIANQQQCAAKLDGLLADYVAVNHYVQGCLKIINDGEHGADEETAVRLIMPGDLADVSAVYEDSETNYHLLAEICQNATIYHSSNPSRAVPLIAQAIDRMAGNNGLAPAMFKLDDEQKLVVANELRKL